MLKKLHGCAYSLANVSKYANEVTNAQIIALYLLVFVWAFPLFKGRNLISFISNFLIRFIFLTTRQNATILDETF